MIFKSTAWIMILSIAFIGLSYGQKVISHDDFLCLDACKVGKLNANSFIFSAPTMIGTRIYFVGEEFINYLDIKLNAKAVVAESEKHSTDDYKYLEPFNNSLYIQDPLTKEMRDLVFFGNPLITNDYFITAELINYAVTGIPTTIYALNPTSEEYKNLAKYISESFLSSTYLLKTHSLARQLMIKKDELIDKMAKVENKLEEEKSRNPNLANDKVKLDQYQKLLENKLNIPQLKKYIDIINSQLQEIYKNCMKSSITKRA